MANFVPSIIKLINEIMEKQMKKNKRHKSHNPISYEVVYEAYLRYADTERESDLLIYKELVVLWKKHLKKHTEYRYSHL